MTAHEQLGCKVVFTPVESSVNGYYEIPGFSKYLISDDGVVISKHTLKKHHLSESATSKGSYLTVTIKRDDERRVTIAAHRLVAMALIGPPPDAVRVFINHIDGNKHNNNFMNLEWVSRSENAYHAYSTGLSTQTRAVFVTDLVTKETIRYHSMQAACLPYANVKGGEWKFIRKHCKNPYLGRYLFNIDLTHEGKVRKNKNVCDIEFKDYRDGKVFISDNMTTAELHTGVAAGTIQWLVSNNAAYPTKGYYFRRYAGNKEWPVFSEDMIKVSLTSNRMSRPIKTFDRSTNTTRLFKSIDEFAGSIGVHTTTIRRILKRNPDGGHFKSYDIAYVT